MEMETSYGRPRPLLPRPHPHPLLRQSPPFLAPKNGAGVGDKGFFPPPPLGRKLRD